MENFGEKNEFGLYPFEMDVVDHFVSEEGPRIVGSPSLWGEGHELERQILTFQTFHEGDSNYQAVADATRNAAAKRGIDLGIPQMVEYGSRVFNVLKHGTPDDLATAA